MGIGLACDVKNLVESLTPLGTAKIIESRLLEQCIPPELYIEI